MASFAQVFPRRTAVNTAAVLAARRCRACYVAIASNCRAPFGASALGQYGYALALANLLLLVPDLAFISS